MLNERQLYRLVTGTVNQHSMGLYKLLFVINSFKINQLQSPTRCRIGAWSSEMTDGTAELVTVCPGSIISPPTGGQLNRIDAAIAIVVRGQKVLICQRKADDTFGNLWEFPGGKQEDGETLE